MKTPLKITFHSISFLFLSLFILQANFYFSQNYTSTIGFKVGGYPAYNALNFKSFMADNWAFDASLGISPGKDSRNISLQCVIEYNKNIGRNSGLNWYAGCGPTVSYWINGVPPIRDNSYNKSSKFYAGLNTVGGVEYTFNGVPLNVALDAGPSLIFFPSVHVNFMVNLALRYVLVSN